MTAQGLTFLSVQHEGAVTVRIATQYWPAGPGSATFMWFCGLKSDMASQKATAVREWAQRSGAGCLLFDYSGHGRSEGAFTHGTISRWLKEAEAVLAHASTFTAPSGIVFVGSSLGGWICLLLARALKQSSIAAPKAVVLIAPAWDMTQVMWENADASARQELETTGVYLRPSRYSPEPYPITRAFIKDGERHLFGAGPVAVDAPVRILHGMRDEDVPHERSLELLKVITSQDTRLTLVKDGEHRLSRPNDLALLLATLEEFREQPQPQG